MSALIRDRYTERWERLDRRTTYLGLEAGVRELKNLPSGIPKV